MKTTTMPENGQTHPMGQRSGSPDPNWITTWTTGRSDGEGTLLRTERVPLPAGRWAGLVQIYHKQSPGRHVATWEAFGSVTGKLASQRVITEAIPNYYDGGFQRAVVIFNSPMPQEIWLELQYTNQHYIWAGATNISSILSKRPIYVIKHGAQTINLVNQSIGQGANAVEFDIQPDGDGFFIQHPFPSPLDVGSAKTETRDFPAYLSHLKNLADSNRLANLVFDCKKPDAPNYAENLIAKIKDAGIPDFLCTLSVPKAQAGTFIQKKNEMGFHCNVDSYLESNPASPAEYVAGVEALGTTFQGVGRDPFARAPMWQWLPWIMELTNARDTNKKYKKAYFWTVNDTVTLRNCLDYGVDGIITDFPSRLRDVLNEAPYRDLLRLATIEDTRQMIVHGLETFSPRPAPRPAPRPSPAPQPGPASHPQEGRYYRIRTAMGAGYLGIVGGSADNGAPAYFAALAPGDDQLWRFVKVGDHYEIVNKKSGRALDVAGASKDGGAAIIQWDASAAENQLWKVTSRMGRFTFVARHSGLVLFARNTEAIQGRNANAPRSRFVLEPVEGGPPPPQPQPQPQPEPQPAPQPEPRPIPAPEPPAIRKIKIRSAANGQFICASDGVAHNQWVYCRGGNPLTFVLDGDPANTSLKVEGTNLYLSFNATTGALKLWNTDTDARFALERQGNGTYALKSIRYNQYVWLSKESPYVTKAGNPATAAGQWHIEGL